MQQDAILSMPDSKHMHLKEPTTQQLIDWMTNMESETACEHAEIVELDGHCSECGAASWTMVMGFI